MEGQSSGAAKSAASQDSPNRNPRRLASRTDTRRRLGVVSGCALLIDYVLTITISIASGADALFTLLPAAWQAHKFLFEMLGVGVLTTLNLRGAKEAVLPWVPSFLAFVVTHAFATMVYTHGSVDALVVLYSINVFITFSPSQLGMVRHGRAVRAEDLRWSKKMAINGVGFLLTAFILVSLTAIQFSEGGWLTLLVTGLLVTAALLTDRHYLSTLHLLSRLDDLVLPIRV